MEMVAVDFNGVGITDGNDYHLRAARKAVRAGLMINQDVMLQYPDGREGKGREGHPRHGHAEGHRSLQADHAAGGPQHRGHGMSMLPTLNMVGWKIIDYELAYEGLRQVSEATCWLQNQPRSGTEQDYHPGAAFIVDLGENWCAGVMGDLLDRLKVIRFPDQKDDDRRILLILQDQTRWGSAAEPLAQILAEAMGRQARAD